MNENTHRPGRGSGRRINIQGSDGKEYNLDQIAESNTRSDSTKPFVSYIKLYNPLSKNKAIKTVVPEDLKYGSIWIARRDDSIGTED